MVNKVILIGNVGADPEVRSLEGGVKVARVRLATTERSYNRQTQEAKEYTEWHNVTLWRNMADVVDRFVKKGSQIYIEGSIRTREWTDESGNKRYSTEIVAQDMKLLGRKPEGAGGQSAPAGQGSSPGGYQSSEGYQAPAQQQAAPDSGPDAAIPADDPDDLPF